MNDTANEPAVPSSPFSGPEIQVAPSLEVDSSSKRLIWFGFSIILLGFGGLGSWATVAEIQSAAIASGFVKVASERKTVQHLEGGIIKEILVQDGDQVEKGQVLIRLDKVSAQARVGLLQGKYEGLLAKLARLQAELKGHDQIDFPEKLVERSQGRRLASVISGEREVFKSRRETLIGEMDVMNQRIAQYEEQIAGLETQIGSTTRQLDTIREELQAAGTLYKKGIYEKPRYLALKRSTAKLEGDIGAHRSSIAQVNQRISEIRLRVIDLQKKRREEINQQLQTVQAEIFDTEEHLRAAKDTLERTEIRAPRDGTVVGLSVHTIGGVIKAGDAILGIVPRDDALVVEAQVRPDDIDIVHKGLAAEVRLTAFDRRTTPALPGTVTLVSADSFSNPNGDRSYYRATVEIDPSHERDIDLYPGMPAEVYVVTGKRTVLDYLVKPVVDGFRRGLREE
jgi:HlyD family type I secretion membrane fusion protein